MESSRQVKAGEGFVDAAPMVDSSALLQAGQIEKIKERLCRDGYLLLCSYLPADKALQAIFPTGSKLPSALLLLSAANRSISVQARKFLLTELHSWKPQSCTSEVSRACSACSMESESSDML